MTPIDSETRVVTLTDPFKIHEMGHLRYVTEPVKLYVSGEVVIVEPATVLVAENGQKLTVVNHEYVTWHSGSERIAYVAVANG